MTRTATMAYGLSLFALLGLGCDDGGGDATPSLDTGLDSGMLAAELPEADRLAGCEAINAFKDASTSAMHEDMHHRVCMATTMDSIGVESINDEAACLELYGFCKALPFDPSASGCSLGASCQATVGEIVSWSWRPSPGKPSASSPPTIAPAS